MMVAVSFFVQRGRYVGVGKIPDDLGLMAIC